MYIKNEYFILPTGLSSDLTIQSLPLCSMSTAGVRFILWSIISALITSYQHGYFLLTINRGWFTSLNIYTSIRVLVLTQDSTPVNRLNRRDRPMSTKGRSMRGSRRSMRGSRRSMRGSRRSVKRRRSMQRWRLVKRRSFVKRRSMKGRERLMARPYPSAVYWLAFTIIFRWIQIYHYIVLNQLRSLPVIQHIPSLIEEEPSTIIPLAWLGSLMDSSVEPRYNLSQAILASWNISTSTWLVYTFLLTHNRFHGRTEWT